MLAGMGQRNEFTTSRGGGGMKRKSKEVKSPYIPESASNLKIRPKKEQPEAIKVEIQETPKVSLDQQKISELTNLLQTAELKIASMREVLVHLRDNVVQGSSGNVNTINAVIG